MQSSNHQLVLLPLHMVKPALPFILIAILTCPVWADTPPQVIVPKEVQTILTTYCVECHGARGGKGNVRLAGWENFTLNERLEVLNKVQDQLFFQMMPPPQQSN
jgi:hypothetical protein